MDTTKEMSIKQVGYTDGYASYAVEPACDSEQASCLPEEGYSSEAQASSPANPAPISSSYPSDAQLARALPTEELLKRAGQDDAAAPAMKAELERRMASQAPVAASLANPEANALNALSIVAQEGEDSETTKNRKAACDVLLAYAQDNEEDEALLAGLVSLLKDVKNEEAQSLKGEIEDLTGFQFPEFKKQQKVVKQETKQPSTQEVPQKTNEAPTEEPIAFEGGSAPSDLEVAEEPQELIKTPTLPTSAAKISTPPLPDALATINAVLEKAFGGAPSEAKWILTTAEPPLATRLYEVLNQQLRPENFLNTLKTTVLGAGFSNPALSNTGQFENLRGVATRIAQALTEQFSHPALPSEVSDNSASGPYQPANRQNAPIPTRLATQSTLGSSQGWGIPFLGMDAESAAVASGAVTTSSAAAGVAGGVIAAIAAHRRDFGATGWSAKSGGAAFPSAYHIASKDPSGQKGGRQGQGHSQQGEQQQAQS